MRASIVGFLAAALMGVCGVASANIVYNVDLTGPLETVTGTITTDGRSGPFVPLGPDDFVSWSLFASGTVSFLDAGPPPLATCSVLGCGIAVVGDILEDTEGFDTHLTLGSLQGSIIFGSVVVEAVNLGLDSEFIAEPPLAPYVIGLASVPEPPAAILLGIGVACLGLACKRARVA